MQRLIREKFSNHTIVAVAHKLDTILDFDKVAVLDGGRLIEFDDPYALLSRDSAFSKLYYSTLAEQYAAENMQIEDDNATLASLGSRRSRKSMQFPASSSASMTESGYLKQKEHNR